MKPKIPTIRIRNRWIPDIDWRDYMVPGADKLYPHYWDEFIEVEVLTVHFQKNTMRVRTKDLVGIQDIPADEFFEQLQFTSIEK
jgi:hypothetical protein